MSPTAVLGYGATKMLFAIARRTESVTADTRLVER